MGAPCSKVALLWAVASLLLVQVLAAVPPASPPSARAKGIDARDAISWLKAQRTEDVRPKFKVRLATSGIDSSTDHPVPPIDTPLSAATTTTTTTTTVTAVRDENAVVQRPSLEEERQTSLSVQHEAASVSPVLVESHRDPDQPTLAVRSAAPKVFGVSIYLIIAWVVLMYLMFRTGSF